MSRLVVELPSAVVTGAVRRANRRRIPLAALVEDALRAALSAEGVAVMLAAVAIAVSGCHASGPVEEPASVWDLALWDSARWASDDSAGADPCRMPATMPCAFAD